MTCIHIQEPMELIENWVNPIVTIFISTVVFLNISIEWKFLLDKKMEAHNFSKSAAFTLCNKRMLQATTENGAFNTLRLIVVTIFLVSRVASILISALIIPIPIFWLWLDDSWLSNSNILVQEFDIGFLGTNCHYKRAPGSFTALTMFKNLKYLEYLKSHTRYLECSRLVFSILI